jgi:hypothetical protein
MESSPFPEILAQKFLNREMRELRKESSPFPQSKLGFAYFAYFAVPAPCHIGMIESPHSSRFILMFSFVRRDLGPISRLPGCAIKFFTSPAGRRCRAASLPGRPKLPLSLFLGRA